MDEIIEQSYMKIPVYSYNILTQPLTTIPLCFAHGDTKNEASKM